MTQKDWDRRPFFEGVPDYDPDLSYARDWMPVNRGFLQGFYLWLKESGYAKSTLGTYSAGVHLAFGFLKKPYWQIDPEQDIQKAWEYIQTRPLTSSTQSCYHKGLLKLADYLRLRCHKLRPEKTLNWDHYLESLPEWLAQEVRDYIANCRRAWPVERQFERSKDLLSRMTLPLRWMVTHKMVSSSLEEITPQAWLAFLDERLEQKASPTTVNIHLQELQNFLRFMSDLDFPVCQRMLRVDKLNPVTRLPRDIPPEQLSSLMHEIQAAAASEHGGVRRMGRMDLAWFFLMLHSGLRTGEVRRLRVGNIDWEGRRVFIEQSKGLKDRIVYLSPACLAALKGYLEVRGPTEAMPEHLFTFRHQPLTQTYCYERLLTYGDLCLVSVTPHKLRHSCATLLLNAGAPILTVQAILGHKWVDTTLGYARLYDGTVAADYFAAMTLIEKRLAMPEDRAAPPVTVAQLVLLVDSLCQGTLNPDQSEVVRQLRVGLGILAEQQVIMSDVKVLA